VYALGVPVSSAGAVVPCGGLLKRSVRHGRGGDLLRCCSVRLMIGGVRRPVVLRCGIECPVALRMC
jgi:hypothetical protein